MRRLGAAALLAVSCTVLVAAQRLTISDPATLPRFDAASIKPGTTPGPDSRMTLRPGEFIQINYPLGMLFVQAFRLRPYEMPRTIPDLLNESFSIQGKAPADTKFEQLQLMVRALLFDRFKLRVHVESAPEDGYQLVLARRDGRLGPNLHRSQLVDCKPGQRAAQPQAAGAECGVRNGPGSIDFGGMPFDALVSMLSNQTGRPVVDATGLSGNFDAKMQWSPRSSAPLRATPDAATDPADGRSLFTAVVEQLGLKLQPTKVPVDRFVIDHIERPEED